MVARKRVRAIGQQSNPELESEGQIRQIAAALLKGGADINARDAARTDTTFLLRNGVG